ncbi:MAG: U32 family peptidase, partial [Actinomycetota bacterium]|nr:U32 family peptidase [Actinomycetota bacterium]
SVRELAALGFERVTLARELSVSQIAGICGAVDVEVESFVHGAICLSYSGQCLLSSVVGGRSANRGACAQPCRLPYELLDENGRELRSPGRYLMSPKDLAGITHLPQLIEAGVSAIKIEGRMKSPEYVAVVTGIYRAALDRAIEDPESFSVTDSELDMLAEVFSRGFTDGYLDGVSDDSIMSFNRPNNRGVPVARVAGRGGEGTTLSLDRAVELGDTLEFWTARGRFAQKVSELEVDGRAVTVAPAGARARMRTEKPVRDGDRVFRVVSAALEAAARRTFVGDDGGRIIPARIGVRVLVGEPLEVRIEAAGRAASATGPVVEPARTKALTAAEVMEHVGRLGSTALRPEGYDIELDPEAGAGFSVLHRVRRDAVDAFEAAVLEPYTARVSATPSVPEPPRVSRRKRRAERDMPDIVVWTTRPKVAEACLLA